MLTKKQIQDIANENTLASDLPDTDLLEFCILANKGYRSGNPTRRDPRPQKYPSAVGGLLCARRQVSDGRGYGGAARRDKGAGAEGTRRTDGLPLLLASAAEHSGERPAARRGADHPWRLQSRLQTNDEEGWTAPPG